MKRPILATYFLLTAAVGCSSASPDYGVGNSLGSRTPPAAAGVATKDASTAIPPGILDASCGEPSACSVSWSKDIFPNMESTGPWQCASASCHGGATSPSLKDGDPTGAYAALATYSGTYPTPYIVPCNADTSKCSMICNLTAGGCGSTMPIGGGEALSAADLATLQAWVECGSPLN